MGAYFRCIAAVKAFEATLRALFGVQNANGGLGAPILTPVSYVIHMGTRKTALAHKWKHIMEFISLQAASHNNSNNSHNKVAFNAIKNKDNDEQ